jgi:hypothetical protein
MFLIASPRPPPEPDSSLCMPHCAKQCLYSYSADGWKIGGNAVRTGRDSGRRLLSAESDDLRPLLVPLLVVAQRVLASFVPLLT